MIHYTDIHCINCDTQAGPIDWQCPACGGVLDFVTLPAFDPDAIVADDFSLWRYRAMLPVQQRISLGEGLTPLVPAQAGGAHFHAKLEYLNPTGSYKDRGTVTMINHLLAQGVTEVVEDSSGNAGASVAAYCSASGIASRIFVPASGSAAKKALIRTFGGHLVEVAGDQYAKTAACVEAAALTPYASHAWSPYFVLGQTTAAWEVWEQLGRRAPDAIVCAVGHGGLFLGFARGFRALQEAGLIEKMPRLIAVQSAGCDPVVRAWESGTSSTPEVVPTHTVADGIIVEKPVRAQAVMSAIYDTEGLALRVDNEAILAAQSELAGNGLIVEPTSATVAAAMPQIRQHMGADAVIVGTLSGSGLKNVTAG